MSYVLRSRGCRLKRVEVLGNSSNKDPAGRSDVNRARHSSFDKTIALHFMQSHQLRPEIIVKTNSESFFDFVFRDPAVRKTIFNDRSAYDVVFRLNITAEYRKSS